MFPTFDAAWRRGLDTTSMPAATTVDGVGANITRTHLSHSNTYGLLLLGSRHRIEDVLIESTDWVGLGVLVVGWYKMLTCLQIYGRMHNLIFRAVGVP